MLWIKKNKQKPTVGSTRIRKVFAYLPTNLDNPHNGTIWLSSYYTLEEYRFNGILEKVCWHTEFNSIDKEFLSNCKRMGTAYIGYWVKPLLRTK